MHRRRPIAGVLAVAALVVTLMAGCDPVPPRPLFRALPGASGPDASPGDGVCATATGGCSLEAAVGEANAKGRARIDVAAGTHTTGPLTVTGDLELFGEAALTAIGAPASAPALDLTVAAGATLRTHDLGLRSLAASGSVLAERIALGSPASGPVAPPALAVAAGGVVVLATSVVDGRTQPAVRNGGHLTVRFANVWAGDDEGATIETTGTGSTALGATAVLVPTGSTPVATCAGTAPTSEGWNALPDATCGLTGTGDRDDVVEAHQIPATDSVRTDAVPVGSVGCKATPATDLGTVVAVDGDGDQTAACDVGAFERPRHANQPPSAAVEVVSNTGYVPATVALSAAGSTDDSGIATHQWSFGDGTPTGSGATTSHVYEAGGTFTVTLTVTDAHGATSSASTTVTVEDRRGSLPLGSPYNYFGTGRLLTGNPELWYQSINPSCTSKINGDRRQSLHYGPLASGGVSLSSCPATPTNADHRPDGYELYVEAPEGRTSDIEVLLYDPRYNDADITWQEPDGEDCVTAPVYNPTSYTPAAPDWTLGTGTEAIRLAGPAQYQVRTSTTGAWGSTATLAWGSTIERAEELIRYRTGATWTPGTVAWTTSTQTDSVTIAGPAVYQTRTSADATTWFTPTFLNAGQQTVRPRDLVRYRTASLPTTTTCTPKYRTFTDSSIDSKRQSGDEDFTFSLAAADETPADDADNPILPACTRTFTEDTAFDLTYLGTVRWNRLCTITPDMPSGQYVLRARNGTTPNLTSDGSNQWGLVARYTDAPGNGVCDGRTDPTCPRVYGKDDISVYANTSSATASFFLAEIDEGYEGRTVEIELWDPGEGGSSISVMKPTGANTWAATPFSWTSFNDDGSVANAGLTNQTSVSVTNSVFNGKLLRIRIPLTSYAPPTTNQWWKLQYTFTAGAVTDRTTWTARIIG